MYGYATTKILVNTVNKYPICVLLKLPRFINEVVKAQKRKMIHKNDSKILSEEYLDL
ncbi:hypothetical protein TRIP_B30026 [uncultured Desulfatiglans sp.]|nr:hypothetical protein TRIP_B30026 [uncultured Desulfatiglans sp.]